MDQFAMSYECPNQILLPNTNSRGCVISGFLPEVDENSTLLGYYTASGGNFLPTSRDNISLTYFGFLTP